MCSLLTGKAEIDTENKKMFKGDGFSSTGDTSSSALVAKANRLISQLRSDPSQLQEIMDVDELSFRFDAGVNIPSKAAKIEDKEDLVIALIKNFLIYSCKGELDKLEEGLAHVGVLSTIRDYHSLMKPLLLSIGNVPLTSHKVLNLFKVVWSPEGSKPRECEEAVILGWTNYVHTCGGEISTVFKHPLFFLKQHKGYVLYRQQIVNFVDVLPVVPEIRYWSSRWW